jgi:2-dehydro-3-deoxyphosphogluconate aldolase/(4S)-4-hydroxy-2-oxoglutarate aldolase
MMPAMLYHSPKHCAQAGLPCAEIAFRTAQAKESIRLIAENLPKMFIGAGTVLTTEQVDEALSAGARFIVSPGLNPKVVKYCLDKNVTMIPGCSNPSDIEQAIGFGLEVVKIFSCRGNRGAEKHQSHGGTLCQYEVLAHRWNQSEKSE